MRNYGVSHYEERYTKVRATRQLTWVFAGLAFFVLVMAWLIAAAHARDLDGRYANNPLHAWLDSLKSDRGLCCSFADGESVQDVDWQTQYQVRLEGKWFTVPSNAVVTSANRFGPAVVWPIRYPEHGAVYDIRCFMPGAGT